MEDVPVLDSPAAAFACFFGLAVLVPLVYLLESIPLEAAICARAVPAEIQSQASARTQTAPNQPLTVFARCCCSNGNPSNLAR